MPSHSITNTISPRVSLEPSVCVEAEMGAGESKLGNSTAFTPGNLGNLDLTKEIWQQLELDEINSIQVYNFWNIWVESKFLHIFPVAFIPFLALAGALTLRSHLSNTVGRSLTHT